MKANWCVARVTFFLDKEALDYWNSTILQAGKGDAWMPNNRTPYKEISHLLPNHYLDVQSCKAYRFWPAIGCISQMPFERGVAIAADLLKKTILGACDKFTLKMSISAGIDSRKTLAATKEIAHKIGYFTHSPNNQGNQLQDYRTMLPSIPMTDVQVPVKLLKKLSIPHYVLSQRAMDNQFRRYYESSVTWARETKGHNAYNIMYYFGPKTTILNSNVSETTQCNYWLPRSEICGQGFAIVTGLYHPMAIKEFDKWLQEAKEPCERAGLNILALFHWEMRAGRWAAAAFSEYDIAHESFTPYNNRYLNKVLLSISERHRRDRMWDVALKIIRRLWPEVLSEPVNPPENISDRVIEIVRRQVLHKYITPWFPIYEFAKYQKRKIRLRKSKENCRTKISGT